LQYDGLLPTGKQRASRNAYRHGLAADDQLTEPVLAASEASASAIVTAATRSAIAACDPEMLAEARDAAHAESALSSIRALRATTMRMLMTAVERPRGLPGTQALLRDSMSRYRSDGPPRRHQAGWRDTHDITMKFLSR
jgi:hypothetical protein